MRKSITTSLAIITAAALLGLCAVSAPVALGEDDKLVYAAADNGDRVVDFSYCGYRGGGVKIPDAPVRLVVAPVEGDATALIQAAIDRVSAMKPDKDGLRGAVLLAKGIYRVSGQVRIGHSGAVLRGSGNGEDGTVLIATGDSRRPLILAGGTDDRAVAEEGVAIVDSRVPVGALSFSVADASKLKPGIKVLIERPSSLEWLHSIGMDQIPSGAHRYKHYTWGQSGTSRGMRFHVLTGSLWWDRTVTGMEGDRITVDAPITTGIATADGGKVYLYTFPGRISRVGIENLLCRSEYDPGNPKDENHSWDAVRLQYVADAWVRQVTAEHFAASAVSVHYGSLRVTVADCESRNPVCEDATGRGRAFYTLGQQIFFLRCRAAGARRAFATGRGLWKGPWTPAEDFEAGKVRLRVLPAANGPIAFVDCTAEQSLGPAGPVAHWASGVLFDNVTVDGTLELMNRGATGFGFGWAAANSVLWNCKAGTILCESPEGAPNRAAGCADAAVQPASLYKAQLAERLGNAAAGALERSAVGTASAGFPALDAAAISSPPHGESDAAKGLRIVNGWFDHGGRIVWGYANFSGYWRDGVQSASLTRNGLDDVCQGRTEDIPALAQNMVTYAYPAWYHSYGLWYDRRRDQHDTGPRADGNVAPPFFEQPWARSGIGRAWDGLSKYDLTKFNSFYFEQLRRFAEEADRKGLILLHNFYLQHCITGNSCHYVDFPWRPVNCIQKVEMPDGQKAANAFYNISNPLHAQLHRRYIRKCLEVLGDYSSVVHLTSVEYSGPASFVKFWMDTIAEWEQETGKDVKIGLGAGKDVMEEILADRERAARIDALELTYWNYLADGTVSAPEGGKEIYRGWPRGTTPKMIYRQLRETRAKYPAKGLIKVIIPEDPKATPRQWANYAIACFMGGGLPVCQKHITANLDWRYTAPPNSRSIQPFCDFVNMHLVDRLQRTAPADLVKNNPDLNWCLADPGRLYLAYASAGGALVLDLAGMKGTLRARWFDPATGKLDDIAVGTIDGSGEVRFESPAGGEAWLLWLGE